MLREYRARRVYERTPLDGGARRLSLSDRAVEIGAREGDAYERLVAWLGTNAPVGELERATGMSAELLERLAARFARAGLLRPTSEVPDAITGEELHRQFSALLPSWLAEAFSHPFWERMASGRGSARLFTGWIFELFHYTKNANRHMPLACASAREKAIKALRARHYAEEWNHYHYFVKSLKALGFAEREVALSVPLPMTLALSNFMRQAAREDVLAYSICSAVLEGTTTDRRSFGAYHDRIVEMYGVPRAAIEPIDAHLALDVKYQHSDLFREILATVDRIPRERASRILDYGHQLVEHVWMWTASIEAYYGDASRPVPRQAFDPARD